MKNILNSLFSLFLILPYCLCLSAQKVNVDYKYYIPENISYDKGLSNAIGNSKTEALRKAGLRENISNYTSLITAETKDDFSEFFRDEILVTLNGGIKEWRHLNPPQKGYDAEKDQFYIDLYIEADVIKYKSKPDPSFSARVEGLRPSYVSDSENPIDLSVRPFQDCYLKVFYISDKEAQVLYPIEVVLGSNQPSSFKNKMLPNNQLFKIDYLYPDTELETEFGKLILIITKTDIPFSKSKLDYETGLYTKTTIDDIFEWILSIEPDQRKEYYEQFVISK